MIETIRKRFLPVAAAATLLAAAVPPLVAASPCRAVQLRVNYRREPLGIDSARPRFSWQMRDPRPGARQVAYEIRVATSAEGLESYQTALWESGRVDTAQSVGVAYDGPALRTSQRYWWSVRVWDLDNHASAWAPAQWWEMGLLRRSDWKAHWIGDPAAKVHSAPLLRRQFDLTGRVRRARVYVTALGSYRLHVNGRRVPTGILTPGWTDYRRRVLVQTWDVTRLLHPGRNALGVELGDGWYGSPLGWKDAQFNFGPPPPKLLLQLEVTYRDGRRETIVSDGSWQVSGGPILTSTIYDGETYDARLQQPGWDRAGFDDSGWQPATDFGAVRAVEPRLVAQNMPLIHIAERLHARRITQPKPGVWVFDMGQNMAGFARLRVRGRRGTRVTLRFAEILKPDGTVYTKNLRSAKATDVYVLRGRGEESFAPHFTYHGFRYIQVTGYPGRPVAADLVAEAFHTALPRSGWIETSSPLVNRIFKNILWSQRSNLMSVPTDCPQRDERLGWMADAEIFWRTASYNMQMDTLARKWMADVVDAQSPAGAFSDVSPRVVDTADGAPAWGDAGVIVPYLTWRQYGDLSILRRNWAAMAKWVHWIHQANPGLLWVKNRNHDFGDWVPAGSTTPKELIATAYFAYDAHLMAEMAHALGKTAAAVHYARLFGDIRAAFQAKYVRPDGTVGNGSQTCYALAIQMNLLPAGLREKAGDLLTADIARRNGHLSTGFVGTGYLLPALTATGHSRVGWQLLLNTTYPSWGYEVRHGGTTIWERWNGDHGDPSMNSYNHYAFGAVGGWIYGVAAGIHPAAQAGFQHFVIAPHPDRRLRWMRARYESDFGEIASRWEITDGARVLLQVVIPANTSATVEVPAPDRGAAQAPAAARFVGMRGEFAEFDVPAGRYTFRGRLAGQGSGLRGAAR